MEEQHPRRNFSASATLESTRPRLSVKLRIDNRFFPRSPALLRNMPSALNAPRFFLSDRENSHNISMISMLRDRVEPSSSTTAGPPYIYLCSVASLTFPSTYTQTHTLTHPFTRSPTRWLIHSLIHAHMQQACMYIRWLPDENSSSASHVATLIAKDVCGIAKSVRSGQPVEKERIEAARSGGREGGTERRRRYWIGDIA